jgi:putative tryptophan/tyrosine transport system substrate-binding protein
MRRREFITLVGGAVLARPLAARAQQPARMTRIGYLGFGTAAASATRIAALRAGLNSLGYIEGKNIAIEFRWAENADELREFAEQLVAQNVDIIVAAASAATQAAKEATATLPIVFINAGDPVGQGFVQSLSRPGANITGIAFDASPDITTKQLQLLLEAVPNASRVAVLWNSSSTILRFYWEAAQHAAALLRASLQSLEVQDVKEYERAFEKMRTERADGLVVLSDSFATFHRARIAELAAKHRLPALYGHRLYVEAGGLMSYGPAIFDAYPRAALT